MAKQIDLQDYINGIKSSDKRMLGKAITLIESKKPEHREMADLLLKEVLPFTGKSIRIGITGVPGAGKSTFIESFGKLAKGEELEKKMNLVLTNNGWQGHIRKGGF